MRAISLHQPWAWFAAHGFKPWETRSWPCYQFGPLLIHASQKVCPRGSELYYRVRATFGDAVFQPNHPPPFKELPRGAIVGRVEFRCCTNMKLDLTPMAEMLGDFTEGRWFLGFENPVWFDKPIPARGYQRIWNFKPRTAEEALTITHKLSC